jgi:inorganic pyrophosphatase
LASSVNKSFSQWRPHPWHGIDLGPEPPRRVNAFIEITPFDLVKYEIDKQTGYLRVDRPQRTSAQPPALYGFIPRTLCGKKFAHLSPSAKRGDGDPLDICVVSERPITKSEIVLVAKVVGGIQMIDDDEADDKIIAVLQNDYAWGHVEDLAGLPPILVERLEHYFSTYKLVAGERSRIQLRKTYGQGHAMRVVEAAIEDYRDTFGGGPPERSKRA